MKLTDIGATNASKTATSKLSKQVQKGSVAAAKQPRLELGVVGISIGQTQSTGTTSRINEAQLNANDVLELLLSIGEMLRENGEGFRIRFEKKFGEEMAFNREHVTLDALRVLRAPDQVGMKMLNALQKVAILENAGNLHEVAEAAEAMEKEGITFEGTVMDVFNAGKLLSASATQMRAHASNVNRIVDFVGQLEELTPDKKTYPFANAALKKLGLR